MRCLLQSSQDKDFMKKQASWRTALSVFFLLMAVAARAGDIAWLTVTESGIHRVTAHDLARIGINLRDMDHSRLALRTEGKPVPLYIGFAVGDEGGESPIIEFYGEPLSDGYNTSNFYSDQRVYVLYLSDDFSESLRFTETVAPDVDPEGPAPLIRRHRWEVSYFTPFFQLVDAAPTDYFFSRQLDLLDKPWGNELNLEDYVLPDFSRNAGAVTLRMKLFGRTTLGLNPDHQVAIGINDRIVDTLTFDGNRSWLYENSEIDPDAFGDGPFSLRVFIPEESEIDDFIKREFDTVFLDWIEFDYSSAGEITDGRYEAFASPSVSGSISSELILRSSDAAPERLYDVGTGRVYDLTDSLGANVFVTPESHFVAATGEAAGKPVVKTASGVSDLVAAAAGSELLVIAYSDFMAQCRRLEEHKERIGISTTVVTVDDVYNAFNHGHKDVIAIRRFVEKLDDSPASLTRYLLLVGGGTKDPRNRQFKDSGDFIPVPYFRTPHSPPYAWDRWYVRNDDDKTFRLSMGRLPVSSTRELEGVIDKIIATDLAVLENQMQGDSLLIASVEKNLQYQLDRAAETLTGLYPEAETRRVYVVDEQDELEEYLPSVLDGFNRGKQYVVFAGHGGTRGWGTGPVGRRPKRQMLDLQGIDELAANDRFPVVLAGTCYTSIFDSPEDIEVIGPKLLLTPGKGAAAVVAPTYRLSLSGATQLVTGYFNALESDPSLTRLGDAVEKMVEDLSDPLAREMIVILGDPTMYVRPPVNSDTAAR